MVWSFLLAILLVTFFLRAYPRMRLPYAIASDTYFHLYLIELIQNNRMRYPKNDDRFLLNTECNYPFFFHWLIAAFGKSGRYFLERYSSAFFDTINNILVFVFTIQFVEPTEKNLLLVLLPSTIYAIHPALIRSGDEPRVHHGSSRVIAQTLYFAHILGFFLFLENGNWLYFGLSIVTGSFIFFTTVFGIQVILFFGILISAFFPVYLVVFPSSLVLSIIITAGRSWKILLLNFQHTRFLFKSKLYYQKIALRTDVKNLVRGGITLMKSLFHFDFKTFAQIIYFKSPHLLYLLVAFHSFLVLFNWNYFNDYRFLYVWMLAAVSLFLISKVPIFRCIGKAERYLEFAFPPSLILTALFLVKYELVLVIAIPYVLFCLTGVLLYNKDFHRVYKSEEREFFEAKEALKLFTEKNDPGIIWTMHPFLYKYYYFTRFKILGYFAGTINKQKSSEEETNDMMGNYPYPGFNFFEITEKYGVKYIITRKAYFKNYLEKSAITFEQITTKFEQIQETDSILILKKRN